MRANSLANPTLDTTLAEALAEAGFDVWLFDYRSSIALPSSLEDHTLDDLARDDWPEGIAEVRRRTGSDVAVVGHCVGSASLMMSLLAGVEGVRSAVCSQFTVHPHTGWLNRWKNHFRIINIVDALGIEGLAPRPVAGFLDKITAFLVRRFPVPRGERCDLDVCRWLNGVFGLTHTHDQLGAATHESFVDAFGNGDVSTLEHLSLMARKQRCIDHRGNDTYVPNVARLDLPILIIQGTKNRIFQPSGSAAPWPGSTSTTVRISTIACSLTAMPTSTGSSDATPPTTSSPTSSST